MKLNELEIKIQISSEEHFQVLFDRCNNVFGPPLSHVLQLDEYYDTPDGHLKKQDLVIRIRSITQCADIFPLRGSSDRIDTLKRAAVNPTVNTIAKQYQIPLSETPRTIGTTKTIALKSPRIELLSGMTSRIELEFLSAEGEKVHEQLLSQGLHPNESAEKERWTFMYDDCEIVLDKLPFIGSFIEIEGPSENAIHNIVHLLNLSSYQTVRKNYGELMMDKFRELQLPLSNIQATFAKQNELLSNL